MRLQHHHRHNLSRRGAVRRGFTLPEILIAIVIIVLLTAMTFPSTAKRIRHARINRAASVVASDLENALSYAARRRLPVRIELSPGATSFTVTEKYGAPPKVVLKRELGASSEWRVASLSFSNPTVDVFQSGITSAPVTITLGDGSYSRQVRLTRAGLVQVIR